MRRRRSSRRAAALLVTLGILLLPPAAARSAPIALGVFVPNAYQHPGWISAYGRQVGRQPVIVLSYKNWSIAPFERPELRRVWGEGAVPMVTWEPETASGHGIPLRRIAEGRYDDYIRQSAEAAARWGKPILLRFAQEMNGGWFPWGLGVNGNTPRQFRKAWRHIYWIFHNHGAGNVKLVWSPNKAAGGPFDVFYPGDRFVNWVGIDGYCWGGTSGWPSFTELFGGTYERLTQLTSKPIIIAEIGVGEEGGDKAEWLTSALTREAPAFSRIRALVWFDGVEPHADFRVNSSPASLAAFRAGIASPRYAATRGTLLSTPAVLPPGPPPPAPPNGGYGAPSFFEELRLKLHGKYLWLAIGSAVVAVVGIAVAGLALRFRRTAQAGRTG